MGLTVGQHFNHTMSALVISSNQSPLFFAFWRRIELRSYAVLGMPEGGAFGKSRVTLGTSSYLLRQFRPVVVVVNFFAQCLISEMCYYCCCWSVFLCSLLTSLVLCRSRCLSFSGLLSPTTRKSTAWTKPTTSCTSPCSWEGEVLQSAVTRQFVMNTPLFVITARHNTPDISHLSWLAWPLWSLKAGAYWLVIWRIASEVAFCYRSVVPRALRQQTHQHSASGRSAENGVCGFRLLRPARKPSRKPGFYCEAALKRKSLAAATALSRRRRSVKCLSLCALLNFMQRLSGEQENLLFDNNRLRHHRVYFGSGMPCLKPATDSLSTVYLMPESIMHIGQLWWSRNADCLGKSVDSQTHKRS